MQTNDHAKDSVKDGNEKCAGGNSNRQKRNQKKELKKRRPGSVRKILSTHKYGRSSVWDREKWMKFVKRKKRVKQFSKTAVAI